MAKDTETKNKWISVDDYLPPENLPVLVFQPNEREELQNFVCAHDGSNWREWSLDGSGDLYEPLTWYDEITHWQLLPNPPKQ